MTRVLIKESVADFAAGEDTLEKIRDFIRDRLLETPLNKKDITGLLLAAEEAVSNIVRHGYLFGPGNIRVRLAHDRQKVTVSFVDSGRTFEWPKKGTPDYQQMVTTARQGGLGLVLIERVTDDAKYFRRPTGENELLLTKNFRAQRGKGLSLRWRWAVAGIALSALAGGIFYPVAGNQAQRRIQQAYAATWINFARTAASATATRILSGAADAEFDELALSLTMPDGALAYLVITDARQSVLADTRGPENIHLRYAIPDGIQAGLFDTLQQVSNVTPEEYYLISPAVAGGRTVGYVHARINGAHVRAEQRVASRMLAAYTVGGVLLCWGLSIVFSGWLVRPLRRLSGAVQTMARHGAEDLPPERGGDEIRQIIGAFNSAADQIHQTERDHYSRELARREWEAAEELQKALVMSEFSGASGFEIGTLYRSAKYVGGDWFDVFSLDDHTFVVSIADVSGKGVPGALVMATVRTAVRLLAPQHREPTALLSAVHQFVAGNIRAGMFVTMYLAVVDIHAAVVNFASAGHTPMLFFRRAEEQVFELNPHGRPLGMQLPEGISFESRLESGNQPLQPGDVFMLFTDGISEARNGQREFFGIPRLKTILAEKNRSSAKEISEAVDARISGFADGTQPLDDLAIVVVKRTADIPDRSDARQPIVDAGDLVALSPAIEQWQGEDTDALTIKLLQVVARYPEFEPPQIFLELGREEYQAERIDEQTVRNRLLRLHLDTRQNRRRFTQWVLAQDAHDQTPGE